MFSLVRSKKTFDGIFPLPHFLEIPAAGVDVSDGSIKFIEITKRGKKFSIGSFGEKKLQPGIVINGEIKDRNALVTILKEIRKSSGIRFTNVSLPEEKAFLFKVAVPNADDESIMTNLSFQLEKKVPVALSEAVFDYDLLTKMRKNQQNEAVVTVFPTEFVESYLSVFNEAGIRPIAFEIEAQAIARAVVPAENSGTFMVIDFGQKRTGLSIVSRGAVVYTSTLEVGGEQISKKIIDIMKVDEEEVTRIKNEIGFSGKGSRELYEAVSSVVLSLKDEINKHFGYWNSRVDETGEQIIEKIYLCGGNSNVAGVKEHLAAELKVPVVRGNVWENLFSFDEYVPPINHRKATSFATAIGLALANHK